MKITAPWLHSAHITNRTDDYSDLMERASAVYQAALNQPYA